MTFESWWKLKGPHLLLTRASEFHVAEESWQASCKTERDRCLLIIGKHLPVEVAQEVTQEIRQGKACEPSEERGTSEKNEDDYE